MLDDTQKMSQPTPQQAPTTAHKQPIWLHITPQMSEEQDLDGPRTTVEAHLHVTIYSTQAEAMFAHNFAGGLVVETASDKLKGNSLVEDVLLDECPTEELRKGEACSFAMLAIGTSLPFRRNSKGIQLSPEANAWMNRFEEASGAQSNL